MERIAVAGLSLRKASVADVERLDRPGSRPSGFLHRFADVLGASELVFLATCNRVEVLYARETGHLPDARDLPELFASLAPEADAERLCELAHVHTGHDAARYLFRVACSLESLVVGEDQIISQLRDATRSADAAGLIGPLLRPLLDQTFRIAKRVRTETELARIPVSVVSLGIEVAAERLAPGARVAVVGAGKMGALLARALDEVGLRPEVIANRSPEAARALAAAFGAQPATIEEFAAGALPVDALFSATSAPTTVLDALALQRLGAATPSGAPLLAVDLALPRDLEPSDDPRVQIIDLETLRRAADQNRGRRAVEAQRAEELIETKLEDLARRRSGPLVEELLAELRGNSEDLLEHALGELHGGRLARLPEADRVAVERWARQTFGRLRHMPVSALRRLASENGNGVHAEDSTPESDPDPKSDPGDSPTLNGGSTGGVS